ncbi:hypothetical protein ACLD6A_01935 [Gardnerella sp. Marseille-Q9691]|uniref:hypothetical protein n=1 Tax=Gardnerella sp. Marseille-Q9691 TaxID=3390096 RepID=UPI00397103C3
MQPPVRTVLVCHNTCTELEPIASLFSRVDIRVVRFEIFRTERGERQSRRLLIRRVKKKNRKISAISTVINE